MNDSQDSIKRVRRQTRKEGLWRFPAAFAAAMLGLSVFISLILVLSSREDAAAIAREAEQAASESNRRIAELLEQAGALAGNQAEIQGIIEKLNVLLENDVAARASRDQLIQKSMTPQLQETLNSYSLFRPS